MFELLVILQLGIFEENRVCLYEIIMFFIYFIMKFILNEYFNEEFVYLLLMDMIVVRIINICMIMDFMFVYFFLDKIEFVLFKKRKIFWINVF